MTLLFDQYKLLPQDWQDALRGTINHASFNALDIFLQRECAKHIVYPNPENWFNALKLAPLKQVRVVIIGQDPYHGPGQAQGLCFSVPIGEKLPPSLINIYKAMQHDLGIAPPMFGDLTPWANQGVLLLNTVLTVRHSEANSHANQGWEDITDAIIAAVSRTNPHVVFLLWGSHAAKKTHLIDMDKHTVLKAAHPSPLSAYRGFLNCKHFSLANDALLKHDQSIIEWALP